MPFIGNQLSTSFQNVETQTITGDGSTSYTLNNAVADGKDLLVYINNVKQEEGSGKSYTATGTTITFTEAVASTDSCYVVFIGQAVGTVTPKDGSIVSSMLADANLEMPNTLDLNGKELILDADADTSITADTDDQIDIKIAGSDNLRIKANEIENVSGDFTLDVAGDISLDADGGDIIFKDGGSTFGTLTNNSGTFLVNANTNITTRAGIHTFDNTDGSSEYMRIGSNGNIGINSTSTDHQLTINASAFEGIQFQKDGSDCGYIVVNTNKMFFGGGDNIDFHTGSGTIINGTTRMRIGNSSYILIGKTSTADGEQSAGLMIGHNQTSSTNGRLIVSSQSFNAFSKLDANGEVIKFFRSSTDFSATEVGSIDVTGSSTSYGTSSDYRLKENIVTDWDASTRLKQLKPSRFNFKVDKDKTVDGFLAHEVSDIVPEAVGGEKDAVDKDGNIQPQRIDQSKLVPLLTKALQESIARADALEARIKKLEGG